MTSADEMNVRVRTATSADHAFLHALSREAYEPLAMRLFGLWDEAGQKARLEAKILQLQFRIVEFAGQPVGAISSSEHGDHVRLHEMMILPGFQGRGIGSVVLRRELRRAEAIGKPLRLHTSRLNRAQEFYRRHGFVETGRDEMFIDMENAGQ
jgi:GNAT superfamily N-acetyltransferase